MIRLNISSEKQTILKRTKWTFYNWKTLSKLRINQLDLKNWLNSAEMSINLETGQHKLTKVKKITKSKKKVTQFEMHVLCCAKLLQLCSTLRNSVDGSPLGSSVHGILHSRILEWVVMPSSRGSSQPRDQTCVSYISCTGRWVLYH